MSALKRIFEHKHREVAQAKAAAPLELVRERAKIAPKARPFKAALEKAAPRMGLIAEVKKASPSRGLIRSDFDAAEIARAYERAGAHALSVLTDSLHFQGSAEDLLAARAATSLPVLRKDFIDDEYQIYESRALGADAVLLIVATLPLERLVSLRRLAQELGMDALVETHTEEEIRAARDAGCDVIGVNNRDLSDFTTSLAVSERLLPLVGPRAFAVSESAIETAADVERVRRAGARAVLIGTTFCAAPDVESKVSEVMGW